MDYNRNTNYLLQDIENIAQKNLPIYKQLQDKMYELINYVEDIQTMTPKEREILQLYRLLISSNPQVIYEWSKRAQTFYTEK